MRKSTQFLLFPLSLVLVAGGGWLALEIGWDPALLPTVATVGALLVVLAAERWLPRVGRRAEAHERRADLTFLGLTALVAEPLGRAAAAGVAAALATWTASGPMAELPLALGVLGVLLVSGLGDYWAHRFGHEWSWWWRLHAVHHAPHRMVALNNLRLHPLDLALKLLFALAPVLWLGFSAEAIALAGAVKGLNVAFQHADVDLRHGWLSRLFSTNSLHRWHHSARAEQANTNYGGVLSLFDQAFGTYYAPPERDEPATMGLFDEGRYPVHGVLRSLVAPLCWGRCVHARAPEA